MLAIVLIVTCFISTGCTSSCFDDVDDELGIEIDYKTGESTEMK